jgi:uncharacterized membrane protein YgcG
MGLSIKQATGGGLNSNKNFGDPLNLRKKKSKPQQTAEEIALERRTQMALDKSIEQQEEAFKALARGKLGSASLLSGAPKTSQDAAAGKRSGGAGGAGSLLGGGSSSGGSRGVAASRGISNIQSMK